MKRRLLLLALLSSCGPLTPSEVSTEPLTTADAGALPVTVADAGVVPVTVADAGTPDAGLPVLTGLPCDVRAVVEARCTGCHSGNTYPARALLTRAAFLELRLPGQSVGQFAVERMQPNAASSMPPYGTPKASPAEVAVMTAWVNAGMPGGSCGAAIP